MTKWYPYIWGKTVRDPQPGGPDFHHLVCHLLDVGAVAEALLADDRAEFLLQRLSGGLGCDPSGLARVLPLLIGIHDLGKASPSFLAKSAPHAERLRRQGAPWPPQTENSFRHDLELGRTLEELLPELGILSFAGVNPRAFWNAVSHGITAHHGRFFKSSELDPRESCPEIPADPSAKIRWSGQQEWHAARRRLVEEVRRLLCPDAPPVPCAPRNLSAALMLLNGFTILCDWIGSDADLFPARGFPKLADYVISARSSARRGIAERGLLSQLPGREEPDFRSLFPSITAGPRPLQTAVDRGGLRLPSGQCLVLVEAAMGEGKTEAAWLLAQRLGWASGASYGGCYFALPTVATSNQMYDRVKRFLNTATTRTSATVLVPVNGMAEFHPDVRSELRNTRGAQGYDEEQSVFFNTWYLPRKRSLLAPYGVGTIDQALLAGLNTRHVGLRLLGLAGKVVIVDEVHAYDLYMSTILDRLLLWLKEMGASVILLSATLPGERRSGLLRLFSEDVSAVPAGVDAPYPLISLAPRDAPATMVTCAGSGRDVAVQLLERPDGAKQRAANVDWLLGQLAPGTRAVWICNTVGEAQRVYLELQRQLEERYQGVPQERRPELLRFHARFLQKDRRAIEEAVLSRFGPPPEECSSPAPERAAILVATQVVEQSLDLDFDLMVSQLAPIDLLLQRLGRLHRHAERCRPEPHRSPRLVLLLPRIGSSGPDWGPYEKVYDPLSLLRTLLALKYHSAADRIEIPGEIRQLVEAVYAPLEHLPDEGEAGAAMLRREWFERAAAEKRRDDDRLEQEARLRLLRAPDRRGSFAVTQNPVLDEDQSEVELNMQTRLGEPTLQAVLLDERDPLLTAARSRSSLSSDEVEQLLERRVSLSHAGLVSWAGLPPFERHPELQPPAFAASNALRRMALLQLDAGRRFAWSASRDMDGLRLDETLGVVYRRDEDADMPAAEHGTEGK